MILKPLLRVETVAPVDHRRAVFVRHRRPRRRHPSALGFERSGIGPVLQFFVMIEPAIDVSGGVIAKHDRSCRTRAHRGAKEKIELNIVKTQAAAPSERRRHQAQ
ncbi:hypothetical protein [Caulobacter hibisci]|uniref:Uncharacterized protein n=1 Tax=Caulobacter hibisci TaxID=2035993 RepID=A0ABS0T0A2_9CAUL|nr:hypothetical protein [Caulobacter hibisci]MBI1684277.1 hypothetical protein [Caulobacter hibisci]